MGMTTSHEEGEAAGGRNHPASVSPHSLNGVNAVNELCI